MIAFLLGITGSLLLISAVLIYAACILASRTDRLAYKMLEPDGADLGLPSFRVRRSGRSSRRRKSLLGST